MDPRKVFDFTEKERKILEWRHAKRKELRELYLKDSTHPTKSLLFDTGIYRYGAAKRSVTKFFLPTVINFLGKASVTIFPIVCLTWILNRDEAKKEHLLRTGQIKYADRHPKFV